MPVLRSQYSVGFTNADLLQRDLGGTLTCPIFLDGAEVKADSGTVTLRKSPGGATVSTGSASFSGDTAAFAVAAGTIASQQYAMGYQVEWVLVVDDVTLPTYRNEVGIVRFAPPLPVSHQDLLGIRKQLAKFLKGTGETSFQSWIETAWIEFQDWLEQKSDSRAHLIVKIYQVRNLVARWTLRNFYREMAENADPDGSLRLAYLDFKTEVEDLKGSLSMDYDRNDAGTVDDEPREADGGVWLCDRTAQAWS